MDNRKIRERLSALRDVMKRKGIDYYLIPTEDFHSSEYVNAYFCVREYFCGFTGSAGTLVVWQEGAGLWTDGRYFIQAEKELAGTGVTLFRMMDEGVPTVEEFLAKEMQEGQTLGFDGRVVSSRQGRSYEKKLAGKKIRIAYEEDLAETIWTDRPAFPCGKVTILPEEIAGESASSKLGRVREKMAKAFQDKADGKELTEKREEADGFLLTRLDDLMWLFNIRGCDVECNPVAMSYGYITSDRAVLFVQSAALDNGVREYLAGQGVEVEEYGSVVDYMRALPAGGRVLVDDRYYSYTFYKILGEKQKLVEHKNPTEALKAVKNPVELAHMEKIYLRDSLALTKFIYWLKTNVGRTRITEVTAADKLEEYRRAIPEFLDLSFPTIAGYKENAAMMHYEATPESCAVLEPEGMLLVDSGGQYLGGTTDVTRTIVLGPISDEIRKHYTLVAAGMLQLTNAHWLHGCGGHALDILARGPVWGIDIDYKCGTGHGVGYVLNVHEGPQRLYWKHSDASPDVVIEDGMDITNEPGVYIEGSHGIRIENVMVARNDTKNEYGQFMHFDTLTWVPIDRAGIDESYLSDVQKKYLHDYQRTVYEKLSPFLTEEEREWLKRETGAEE